MRVARLHHTSDIRLHDEPAPASPAPGHSTVQISAVGICGSDLHWYTDGGIGDDRLTRPVVPGHEFAGTVITGPRAGQRVAVDPAIPCERCRTCLTGHHNLCPFVRFAGHGALDGGLQQLLTWPDHLLVPVPDSISSATAVLLEPLGVAIHAIRLAHLTPGADVLITGAGPIGLLAIGAARHAGAGRVFISEPLPHRRDAALRLGADLACHPSDIRETITEQTAGHGVDRAIEMAGTDHAIADTAHATRPGGRIVLGGIPTTDTSRFPASVSRRKGLTYALVRRMYRTYPTALAYAANRDLDALITRRFTLDQSAAAFSHAAARNGIKTLIDLE